MCGSAVNCCVFGVLFAVLSCLISAAFSLPCLKMCNPFSMLKLSIVIIYSWLVLFPRVETTGTVAFIWAGKGRPESDDSKSKEKLPLFLEQIIQGVAQMEKKMIPAGELEIWADLWTQFPSLQLPIEGEFLEELESLLINCTLHAPDQLKSYKEAGQGRVKVVNESSDLASRRDVTVNVNPNAPAAFKQSSAHAPLPRPTTKPPCNPSKSSQISARFATKVTQAATELAANRLFEDFRPGPQATESIDRLRAKLREIRVIFRVTKRVSRPIRGFPKEYAKQFVKCIAYRTTGGRVWQATLSDNYSIMVQEPGIEKKIPKLLDVREKSEKRHMEVRDHYKYAKGSSIMSMPHLDLTQFKIHIGAMNLGFLISSENSHKCDRKAAENAEAFQLHVGHNLMGILFDVFGDVLFLVLFGIVLTFVFWVLIFRVHQSVFVGTQNAACFKFWFDIEMTLCAYHLNKMTRQLIRFRIPVERAWPDCTVSAVPLKQKFCWRHESERIKLSEPVFLKTSDKDGYYWNQVMECIDVDLKKLVCEQGLLPCLSGRKDGTLMLSVVPDQAK